MANESPGGPDAAPVTASKPPSPRAVDGGRGVSWWGEGWRLFVPGVGAWLLIVVILLVLQIVLGLIPFVGHLASSVLFPVFVGGLMLGCRAVDRGERLSVSHLFAGFHGRLGPLVLVGVIYTAITVAIVLAVMGVLVVSFGAAVLAQLFELQNLSPYAVSTALGGLLLAFLVGALLFLALSLPLVMAVWFAPALVVLQGSEPWAAMKLSFSGCLGNIVPFLLYGLVGIALAVAASLPLMLGWFVLGPVTVASVYASYCDIFEDERTAVS